MINTQYIFQFDTDDTGLIDLDAPIEGENTDGNM